MTKSLFTFITLCLSLASCSTSKDNLTYFTNLGNQTSGAIPSGNYELKIIPDDELVITVTSLVPEATAQFNTPMTNIATRSAMSPTQQSSLMTYVVDRDGYIMMPVLGKIKVAGLTTAQISDVITKEVSKSVTDPYVRVQLMNFRVNVLGEYGGIGYPVKEHLWNDQNNWGYVKFNSSKEVTDQYEEYAMQLLNLVARGFSAAVYTQTTDVEMEVNGFMTYDRKVVKMDEKRIRAINQKLVHSLDKQ